MTLKFTSKNDSGNKILVVGKVAPVPMSGLKFAKMENLGPQIFVRRAARLFPRLPIVCRRQPFIGQINCWVDPSLLCCMLEAYEAFYRPLWAERRVRLFLIPSKRSRLLVAIISMQKIGV